MSEGKLGEILEKAGMAWSRLTHKSCVDAEASQSQLQAFTDETVANAAGFAAFNDAFMRGDVDAVMAAMTDDPIFDAPNPQPDGMCFRGRLMVRAVWEIVFKSGVRFETEESFVIGDRAVVRWVAHLQVNGEDQTLRGADVFHLEGGKVAAKLTYSKADAFPGLPTLPS